MPTPHQADWFSPVAFLKGGGWWSLSQESSTTVVAWGPLKTKMMKLRWMGRGMIQRAFHHPGAAYPEPVSEGRLEGWLS